MPDLILFVQVPAPPPKKKHERKVWVILEICRGLCGWKNHGKFSWRPPTIANKDHEDVPKSYESSFMEFYSWPTVRLPSVTWPSTCFLLGELNVPTKKMLRLGEFAQKMSTCKKKPFRELPSLNPHPLLGWVPTPHSLSPDILNSQGLNIGEMFHGLLLLASRKPKGEFLSKLSYHILPVFWILIG